jgi:hypothetical protein
MTPFAAWLEAQQGRTDMVGRLARYVRQGAVGPGGRSGYRDWWRHLERAGAPHGALRALALAWREYGLAE